MPATTTRRRSRSSVNENIPTIEVEIPPSLLKSVKVKRSGPKAKNVDVKVEHNETDDAENIDLGAATAASSEEQASSVPPKTRGRNVKKEVKSEVSPTEPSIDEPVTPVRKRRRAATKPAIVEKDQDDMDDSKTSTLAALDQGSEASSGAEEQELDSDGEPVRRGKNGRKIAKRKKKTKEPVVYTIPSVPSRDFCTEGPIGKREERKEGFKGRLGYACLNTILRSQDPAVFCSRNVRIKTIEEKGLEWVKSLALQNVKDIIPLLEFNAANNIHMMRLSSEIFPFAGHEKYGYDINFAAKELAEAGEVARRLNQRLTMHPGQFCVLGTPHPKVLEASIRELEVHAKVLDLMGIGPDGVMILHGGGTYGDREAATIRIKDTIENKLPDFVRRRLVLENDEMSYSAEELLPLCESLDPPVPLVFDFHHDLLRPSSWTPAEIIQRAQAIFAKRGITPKYHLSEPRPGARSLMERRAHSDRCAELPADLPYNADLMLECKDKEQGVLEMYRIYNLFPVIHDNLRPPADDLTTSTGGRRSKLNGSGGAKIVVGGEASRSPSPTASPSPVKQKKPTEASMIEKAIEKAKAAAIKRGVKYEGPQSKIEKELARGPIQSAVEVKEDMAKVADWIRSELQQGRERRPFPGAADEANMKEEAPEPDAY
ncbi:hypothetical protein CBS101457_006007 [Exobasidium rhododendri]|nr:hypothetical protein CBS101457_006007 [Exobasidium rhododendri]